MKKKQTQFQKNIMIFFLCFLMLFNTFAGPIVTYAAVPSNFIYWSTLKANAVDLTTSSYAAMQDITTYGANMSTWVSQGYTWDTSASATSTRLTYQKAFKVSYNTTISLLCAKDGEESKLQEGSIAWCVLEWDANGNLLFDGNWINTTQSYTVGVSNPTGCADYSSGTRSSRVQYVTVLFRYIEGGNLANAQGTVNISASSLASNLPNLYIISKPFTYTISNNGSTSTVSRTGISAITPLTTPSKTGYTFNGWSVSSSSALGNNWMNGNKYATTTLNTYMSNGKFYNSLFGNVTFTADYSANTYTIVYNANGGTGTTASSTHTYDTAKALTANGFSRTGYTFVGWATTSAGGVAYSNGQSVSNLTATNGDTVNLYAVWTPNTYTITLNNQSATSAGTSVYYEKYNVGIYSTANCTSSINTITNPTRTGYTFGGYYTGTGGSGTQCINASGGIIATKTSFAADTTLYAKWTVNSYTIRYNANGGTGSMSDTATTYGTQTTLRSNTFTRNGYTFAGWATTTNGGVVYSNGAKVTSLSSQNGAVVNLYAVWEKNSYTVTYNANGGTTSAASRSVAYGGTVDLSPIASKPGYTFIGWSTSNTARIPLSSYTMPAGNITLYAVYSIKVSDIQNHTHPDYTGTPGVNSDEVYLLVWITASPSEHKFYPLTYSQDVNTMVYRYILPTTDISSFVNGRAYSYQLVVYDNAGNSTVLYKGGGAGDTQPEVIVKPKYTQTVNHYIYNPIRNAYNTVPFLITNTDVEKDSTFTPSYVTPPAGYSASSKDAGKVVTSATVYSAYYRPNTYTITYNANGGTVEQKTKTVTYDAYYPTHPTPTRTGYTFLGWNTAQDGTGTVIRAGDIYTTVGNQTLYAQWKADVYEIKLDGQGAENPGTEAFYQKYDIGNFTESTCGTAILKIRVPIRNGYTFGGYYTEKGGLGTQYVDASGNILSTKTTFTANRTLYAKWTANTYTVKYNANGGTGDMTDMTVTYDTTVKLSSNLFERTGYTFAGWATEQNGAVVYVDKQSITNLSTVDGAEIKLYAVWDINSYEVTYDYWTNGGNHAENNKENVNYNAAINLSVSAEKGDGYTFVGWNTDASATTGLDFLTMGTESITLYAIFEKTITLQLIEMTETDSVTRTFSETIFNNTTQVDFEVSRSENMPGWIHVGWSDQTGATADVVVPDNSTYTVKDNAILYALYTKNVSVSYDTNGSSIFYDGLIRECYYNASGENIYPSITLAKAPVLTGYSFESWMEENGMKYQAEENVVIKHDTNFIAQWDRYPEIEAYDRYFTLEQAQTGQITEMELLRKVIATDEEAKRPGNEVGRLTNGVDVIVENYEPDLFVGITDDMETEITYQVTDSFGNIVTKTITVYVVDTAVEESPNKKYVRFISSRFYKDEDGNLLEPEKGGLELNSVWRENANYSSLLESVLSNMKVNEEYKEIKYFGTSTEIKVPGSGDWKTDKSTWVFTKDDIEEVKEFVDTYGYGNIRESNALELFIEAFKDCLKLN